MAMNRRVLDENLRAFFQVTNIDKASSRRHTNWTETMLILVRSWHSPRALWILKSWHMEARSERKEHRLTNLLSFLFIFFFHSAFDHADVEDALLS